MARTRVAEVACPGCAVMSKRVHSTYGRCLADTPVGDRPVLIELTVRRLYCENVRCSRRTFAEQVEGLTVRYGRRTPAARRVLEAVAVALAGRAGSRLAAVLHAPVSRTTLEPVNWAATQTGWATGPVRAQRRPWRRSARLRGGSGRAASARSSCSRTRRS
ncbi:transposase family protein [Streptomyces mirabilis]|uniref:transposase family protein n=1 Tax=Streptomyces mirabilis TaxID=68239 RepID=UPI0024C3CEB7|nr:transposase family protein [Streptomyces mirabilis]